MTHTVKTQFFDNGRVTAVYLGNQGRPVGECIVEDHAAYDIWLDTFPTREEADDFIKQAREA